MYSYILIDGGFSIVDADGNIVQYQPFNPETSQPYSELQAQQTAEEILNSLNITTSNVTLIGIQSDNIRTIGAQKLKDIYTPYTQEEVNSWAEQMAEANAWTANPSASIPLLQTLASIRGVTIEKLVSLIYENFNLFSQASGYILGTQQSLLDRLWSLPSSATAEEISAINWE